MAAYCTTTDLLIAGNFPIPVGFSKQQYVDDAAEEIDIAIGRLYKTPVEFETADLAEKFEVTIKFLKHLNAHLATGRLVMAVAMPGEDNQLNAYGASLVGRVEGILREIANNEIYLEGAPANSNATGDGAYVSPHGAVSHMDEKSGVEAFYNEIVWNPSPWGIPRITPYNVMRDPAE